MVFYLAFVETFNGLIIHGVSNVLSWGKIIWEQYRLISFICLRSVTENSLHRYAGNTIHKCMASKLRNEIE